MAEIISCIQCTQFVLHVIYVTFTGVQPLGKFVWCACVAHFDKSVQPVQAVYFVSSFNVR